MLFRLLKTSWTFGGLNAPAFAWAVAAGLLAGVVILTARLFWIVWRACRAIEEARAAVEAVRTQRSVSNGEGAAPEIIEGLGSVFDSASFLAPPWRAFVSQLVPTRDRQGRLVCCSPESAATPFSDSRVIGSIVNRNFYAAVPGMLTGIGLLVTFVAILIALLDLRIVDNRIVGLSGLIEGLSGKFVSSIAALFAATVFMLVEKLSLHRLEFARVNLVAAIDEVVPRLSAATLLANLQESMAEQLAGLRAASAEFASRLQQSSLGSMQPALEQLVAAIGELNRSLQSAGAAERTPPLTDVADRLGGRLNDISVMLRAISDQISEALGIRADKWSAALSVELQELLKQRRR